jgi:hypothetical protein
MEEMEEQIRRRQWKRLWILEQQRFLPRRQLNQSRYCSSKLGIRSTVFNRGLLMSRYCSPLRERSLNRITVVVQYCCCKFQIFLMELKERMSVRVEEERDKQEGFVNFTKVMKKGVVNCYGFELQCYRYSVHATVMLRRRCCLVLLWWIIVGLWCSKEEDFWVCGFVMNHCYGGVVCCYGEDFWV